MVAEKTTKAAAKPAAAKPVVKKAIAKPVTKKAGTKPSMKKATELKKAILKRNAAKTGEKKEGEKKKRTRMPRSEVKKLKKLQRHGPILSGKFTPSNTIKKPKTLFFGNFPRSATREDLKTLLGKDSKYVTNIRFIISKSKGKFATLNKEGKVIPYRMNGAFVVFKTQKIRKAVQAKKLTFKGEEMRMEVAKVKKRHVAKMQAQADRKKAALAKKREALKAVKEDMHKNLLKNKKRSNRRNELRAKKASIAKYVIPGGKDKRRTVLKKRTRQQERARLSGDKARKAMARRTRK